MDDDELQEDTSRDVLPPPTAAVQERSLDADEVVVASMPPLLTNQPASKRRQSKVAETNTRPSKKQKANTNTQPKVRNAGVVASLLCPKW
jgi:hypothetical protein